MKNRVTVKQSYLHPPRVLTRRREQRHVCVFGKKDADAVSSKATNAALAAAVLLFGTQPAFAEITPVYFGNGCFWGRQKDFVDTEMKLGRTVGTSTAVVGYAGGQENSKSVCYYYNAPETLYEKQGHAEVVQVGLDTDKAAEEFGVFAETYFSQFKKTPRGMIRLVDCPKICSPRTFPLDEQNNPDEPGFKHFRHYKSTAQVGDATKDLVQQVSGNSNRAGANFDDPQDRGPGYRNVVGIPGGIDSELFQVFKSKNINNMNLIPGEGGTTRFGKATENDIINTVYIVDSNVLPFHQAEMYHQYHNGMTKDFGAAYLVDMKKAKIQDKTIGQVAGCLEYPF